MDIGRVLGGLLGQSGQGGGQGGGLGSVMGSSGLGGSLGSILGGMRPPMGGAAGAAAAGGLLGSLLGGRGGGGGLLRTGGMAVAGLLAYRAYEQWKSRQPGAAETPAMPEYAQAAAPAGEGEPFGLALVRAMVAAARADGALDPDERERIFAEAERLDLDDDDKAEMFRILETPADPTMIASLAATDAQKAELYTVSAMITGGDSASERAYLAALAGALRLPAGLRARLDAEVQDAALVVAKTKGANPF